jgi:glycosyltransferase involved in cell wall biosynthesis
MHILIVNSEYPPIGGGAGNASAHIARTLVRMGERVTVLTAGFRGLASDEIVDGVHVLRLPGLRRKLDRSTAAEQFVFMKTASLWGLWRARQLKPEFVLAFFGIPSGAAVWFWNFFVNAPYAICLRGGDVPGFRPYDFGLVHRVMSPLLRQVWQKASAVVANSQGLRAMATRFDDEVPVQVIPNGVDLNTFANPERNWESPRLLFVGRVVYQKGLDLLLDALVDLRHLDWQLDIVGDGPRRRLLAAQADRLGLGDRVFFKGWQPREALPEIFRRATLFVYPSRHEGMPNAVLEAMASGLPVVATQIPGNEELVEDGRTGRLVPTEDRDALRAVLEEMIGDPETRQRMGTAARGAVEKKYTWEGVARAYLDLILKSNATS